MLRMCSTLFCRKAHDEQRECAEAHPSNTEAAHTDSIRHVSSLTQLSIAEAIIERDHKGGGWLLSGIFCGNILLLGCALVTGSAISSEAITAVHRQVFLILLLLLTIFWMLFYKIFTARKDQAILYTDSHAGHVWLRAGLVVFGLLSLIMDMFKIANYVGYLHCDSAVNVAFPVVQAIFIFIQTYFLWVHAKDCVQLHKNFTRCGLILMLSTNLVIWMAAVAEESVHQTDIPANVSITRHLYAASYKEHCKCMYSSCSIFKKAFYYLYPFNIEYSLFASAMIYVMWKNVGRPVERCGRPGKFRMSVCVGPVLGILLVLSGLATFIVYETDVTDEGKKDEALLIHFVVNIVIAGLMLLATAVGCVIYRLDRRERVCEKNPTRSLDVGLLKGASLGQFLISFFSIVAMVATEAKGYLNGLNLAWALLTVAELSLQNYFIIEGLHREPLHVIEAVVLRPRAAPDQGHVEMSLVTENKNPRYFWAPSHHGLNWKRRLLKEVCAFLLLANIILWIMPAFGARPQFDHAIETKFFTFAVWAAIVNIGLPFGIFYRMHSVASLFEVYMIA